MRKTDLIRGDRNGEEYRQVDHVDFTVVTSFRKGLVHQTYRESKKIFSEIFFLVS